MIGIIFDYTGEKIEVRVKDDLVLFRTSSFPSFTSINGLKLDKKGVIEEFPDLKDKENWKEEATKRFKEKIKQMKSEEERIQYIIKDLTKYGYKPLFLQKEGFRPIKLYK